jgi:hypothetical protein
MTSRARVTIYVDERFALIRAKYVCCFHKVLIVNRISQGSAPKLCTTGTLEHTCSCLAMFVRQCGFVLPGAAVALRSCSRTGLPCSRSVANVSRSRHTGYVHRNLYLHFVSGGGVGATDRPLETREGPGVPVANSGFSC